MRSTVAISKTFIRCW